MWTSNGSALAPAIATPSRVPLRLRMAEHPGRNYLDGGWWPQSRDLLVELADLVDHFPAGFGRIVSATVSRPDWEVVPRHIRIAGGSMKVGSFPREDTHLVTLKTSDRAVLRVLVVPSDYLRDGDEALLAAATIGSARSPWIGGTGPLVSAPASIRWMTDCDGGS